jgi:hypothetical protein
MGWFPPTGDKHSSSCCSAVSDETTTFYDISGSSSKQLFPASSQSSPGNSFNKYSNVGAAGGKASIVTATFQKSVSSPTGTIQKSFCSPGKFFYYIPKKNNGGFSMIHLKMNSHAWF